MTDGGPEVLVLGGGPAGCAAACLLARCGHAVVVRTKNRTDPSPLAESIPPSSRKLIDLLGLGAVVDAAEVVRSTGNTVWWGSDHARVEPFAGGQHGWQVTRDGLENRLAAHLSSAGVRIERADEERIARNRPPPAFTLDCTGRSGVLARGRGLRVLESHRIVALSAVWRHDDGFGLADPSHTLVESYEGGWAWSVPLSVNQRVLAVMVDPATSGLVRSLPARDVYLREVERTSHLATLAQKGVLVSGPAGWDASMYRATRYVDGDVLLVGDAASFIDPLSSAGIKKALASGWLAAVAVHTSLVRPEMRDVAFEFFASREAEVYASFRAMTDRMLAGAASGHIHPFWNDRIDAEWSSDAAATSAAFEHLRAQPTLRVRRNPGVWTEPKAAVSGTEIVMETRLVSAGRPQGIRYAFDVDLIGLIELAPAYAAVPDLFAAYNRQHSPVAMPDFLGALSTSLAQKWLLWV